MKTHARFFRSAPADFSASPQQPGKPRQEYDTKYDSGKKRKRTAMFDTFSAVKDLTRGGFNQNQSETMMRAWDTNLYDLQKRMEYSCVPRDTFTRETQRQWSELDSMRRDILVMEKTHLFNLRREFEKYKMTSEGHTSKWDSELQKLENGNKLDQNLLKSKMQSEVAKAIESFELKLTAEMARIENVFENRVQREVSQAKLDAYRTMVTLAVALTTLVITYLRFFPAAIPEKPSTPERQESTLPMAALIPQQPAVQTVHLPAVPNAAVHYPTTHAAFQQSAAAAVPQQAAPQPPPQQHQQFNHPTSYQVPSITTPAAPCVPQGVVEREVTVVKSVVPQVQQQPPLYQLPSTSTPATQTAPIPQVVAESLPEAVAAPQSATLKQIPPTSPTHVQTQYPPAVEPTASNTNLK